MQLPYDVSAERGVICTLILYPKLYFQCQNLKPEHFYDSQNGVLFWAIQNLIGENIYRIDDKNLRTQIVSDSDKAKMFGKDIENQLFELIENSEYLARSSTEEYKKLANRIIATGFKRELYRQIKFIENKCLTDATNDISQIKRDIDATMSDLAIKYIMGKDVLNFGDKIDELWANILENRNEDGTIGYSTGFPTVDKYFTYRGGELVVVEANRKTGKSVWGLNTTYHLLKCGLSVVYLETEMLDTPFLTRFLSHMTKIPENNIASGNYSREEAEQIEEAKQWIKEHSLVHEFHPNWTREQVVDFCTELKREGRLDFFIFDYPKSSTDDAYKDLGDWINTIKNEVCGALNIPGLTFAQLNRTGQTGDSYRIEQYASTGAKWRPKTSEEIVRDGKECGDHVLQVMFNRNGASHADENDYIDFVFKKPILTMEEAKCQHKIKTPFDE